MPPWLRLAAALLTAVALAPSVANAGDVHVFARLQYDRDATAVDCPDETELRRLVTTRLGHDPFRADAERIVRVEVERKSGAFAATVQLSDARGQAQGRRELRSSSSRCDDLADALQLAIGIALDPLPRPLKEPSPPEPSPPVTPPPEPLPAPAAPPIPTPQPSPTSYELAAHVEVNRGLLPSTSLRLGLGASARRGDLSLGIEGRGDLPAGLRVPGGEISGSSFSALVVGCAWFSALGVCLDAGAAQLRLSSNRRFDLRDVPVAIGLAGVRADYAFFTWRALRLRATAELAAALGIASMYDAQSSKPLWSSSALTGSLGLASAWEWP